MYQHMDHNEVTYLRYGIKHVQILDVNNDNANDNHYQQL